jgi:hypothetical protein
MTARIMTGPGAAEGGSVRLLSCAAFIAIPS